jgi:hypothetical protein
MKTGCPLGAKHNSKGLRSLADCPVDVLRGKYAVSTTAELALEFGVSPTAVRNRLLAANIERRSLGERETFKNARRTLPLSDQQRQLVFGSLLGDACLYRQYCESKAGTKFSTLKLCFAHGADQLAYLRHKRSVMLQGRQDLDKPCVSEISERPERSNLGKQVSQFAFSHTPTLEPFAKICHNADDNKFVSESWANQISTVGLAYWYQDDGCLIHKVGGKSATLRWATNSFSSPELDLLKGILRRFGAKSITEGEGNYDPDQRILLVNRYADVCAMLEQMKPYIIPELNYKIRCIL